LIPGSFPPPVASPATHRDRADRRQITVSGAGVTLRLPAGKTAKTRLQYAIIALTKRNTDEWILSGDLA
jgi:hypothetical protein